MQPHNVQHFFEEFVFCPVTQMCNTQEKFQLQNDKNERNLVEHGFQNDNIDLQTCFLDFISKYSTVIHHKLTLLFQNGLKRPEKFHLYF